MEHAIEEDMVPQYDGLAYHTSYKLPDIPDCVNVKGGLHPYPGVAKTLVTKVLHWRSIPITGDQIAIYYMQVA